MTVTARLGRADLSLIDSESLFREDPPRAVATIRALLRDAAATEERCRLAAGVDALFGDVLPLARLSAEEFAGVADILAGRRPPAADSPAVFSKLLADPALTRRAAAAIRPVTHCPPQNASIMSEAKLTRRWQENVFDRVRTVLPAGEAEAWHDRLAGWTLPRFAGVREDHLRRLNLLPVAGEDAGPAGVRIPPPTGVLCTAVAGGERWRPMTAFLPGCGVSLEEGPSDAAPVVKSTDAASGVEFTVIAPGEGPWHRFRASGPAAAADGAVSEAGEGLLLRPAVSDDRDVDADEGTRRAALLAGKDASGVAVEVLLGDARVAAAWRLAHEWAASDGWEKSFGDGDAPLEGPHADPLRVTRRQIRTRMWLLHFHAGMMDASSRAADESALDPDALYDSVSRPLSLAFFHLATHGGFAS